MSENIELNYPLQTGKLKVVLASSQEKSSAEALFRVAERYNPKRSFLFVSTVLGKHFPSRVSSMDSVFQDLCDKLPSDVRNYAVIAMAETAIGLGAGVFQRCVDRFGSGIFGTSTRFPSSNIASNFSEPHSHATEQCLCLPSDTKDRRFLERADDLIFIDDELTTGRTIRNLACTVLAQTGIRPKRIFVLSITDWSQGALDLEIPDDIQVSFLSLVKGRYSWEGNGNQFDLPAFTDCSSMPDTRMAFIDSPRNWLSSPVQFCNWPASVNEFVEVTEPGEKVLVVGTGEFMAKPLAVAQHIEAKGGEVYFSSTTRSPAMTGNSSGYFEGYGVRSRIVFPDLYQGQGMNYLYNHDLHCWNRILLYTDAKPSNISSDLIQKLKPDHVASDFELIA